MSNSRVSTRGLSHASWGFTDSEGSSRASLVVGLPWCHWSIFFLWSCLWSVRTSSILVTFVYFTSWLSSWCVLQGMRPMNQFMAIFGGDGLSIRGTVHYWTYCNSDAIPTIPHPIWIPPTVDAWADQDGTKPSRSSSNEHRSVTRSKSIKGLPGKSQNA